MDFIYDVLKAKEKKKDLLILNAERNSETNQGEVTKPLKRANQHSKCNRAIYLSP